MRVFIAELRTETNSFVERPTTLDDFMGGDGAPPSGAVDANAHPGYATFLACAQAERLDIVRGPAAYAVPGGPVASPVYAALRSAVLEAARAAAPFDVALLNLHGAMAAEDVEDCEGDLLTAFREIAGEGAVIATLLDPHATLSPAMVSASNLVTAYKEYPHDDVGDRARELFALAMAAARGEVRPVAAVEACRMLGGFPTKKGPMAAFVASMKADEAREGVLAVSLIHGFPWADSPYNGAKALVYADADAALARNTAHAVAERFRAIAAEAVQKCLNVDDAVARARAWRGGLLILADVSDNPGGGADGDATHLLGALIAGGAERIGAALVNDRAALEACLAAGAGAELTLSIGGKRSYLSGPPLVMHGKVAGLAQSVGPGPNDAALAAAVGPIARFATPACDVILCGERREALWPGLFEAVGARLRDYRFLVLKSSNHFRASFEPLADEVLSVGSPTAMNPDLAAMPFRRVPRPMWPLDNIGALERA